MISIVIPVTREEHLQEAIESIKWQSYKDIEIIIVVDNPSLNLSLEGVKILKNEKNLGVSASRNIGLREASGEYVCFLDDDDYFNNVEALQDLHELISTNNTDIALSINFSENPVGENINSISLIDYYRTLANDNGLRPASNKVFRRDYLIMNNLFFIENYTAEEDELLYRLLINNPSISIYNKNIYFYRQDTAGSIMKSLKYQHDKAYINILSRERILKSNLDNELKSKILSNINNSLRNNIASCMGFF